MLKATECIRLLSTGGNKNKANTAVSGAILCAIQCSSKKSGMWIFILLINCTYDSIQLQNLMQKNLICAHIFYNAVYVILPLQSAVSPECQPVRLCSTNTFFRGLSVAFTEPLRVTVCFPAAVGNMDLKFAAVRYSCITRVCKTWDCMSGQRCLGRTVYCSKLLTKLQSFQDMRIKTDIRFSLSIEILLVGKLILLHSFLGNDELLQFLTKLLRFFKLTMPMRSTDLATRGSISGKPTRQSWSACKCASLYSRAEHLNAPPSGSAAFCHRVVDKCPRRFRVSGKKTYLWVHLLAEHRMANTSNNNPEPEKPAVRGHLWKPRQNTLTAHACPFSPDMQGLWHASTIEI